jgi:hypothetical protein
MGLEKTQHIGRIVVHPTDPDIVYVAALGALYGPNPERGLQDHGRRAHLDAGEVHQRPRRLRRGGDGPPRPERALCGELRAPTHPLHAGERGAGSALWKTEDGGRTWTEIVGDAGRTWDKVNDYNDRPFYYSQVRVDPQNSERAYFSSSPLQVSDDGGRTSRTAANGVHVDTHGIWIDPNDPSRWAIAKDGGFSITFDRGGTFFSPMNLPVTQFYHGRRSTRAWSSPSATSEASG